MRRLCSLVLSIAASCAFLLSPPAARAQSGAAAGNGLDVSPIAVHIWTDKYVYTPGEPITVRMTARANGDTTPYAALIYRQNNQTGAKYYFPANTTTVTDIGGRTPDQGLNTYIFGDVTKWEVIGPGGWLSTSMTAPSELGMHTMVIQIRDATGTRVVKSDYFKFGVVSGFETISGNITGATTLVNTKAYNLSGVVFVKGNPFSETVLTIEPGTFIFGQPGSQPPSALIVTTSGRINASGTRSRPIVMTSSLPFGQRSPGDWGGLILLGNAPVNLSTGFGNIEGLPATEDTRYGGTNAAHNCGTLRYVRLEYAGVEFQPNNEVNAFTFGGCGTGTVAEYLQSRYGLDDAFEWFGGTMNAKYLVGFGARDDYFDAQLGWAGKVQHAVAMAPPDVPGNRGFEVDNSEFDNFATPQTSPRFYNVTLVGAGNTQTQGFDEGTSIAGVWLRRGTFGAFNNMVVFNWGVTGFTIADANTETAVNTNNLTVDGLLMFDNGKASGKANNLAGQSATSRTLPFLSGTAGTGRNARVQDPLLRRPLSTYDPDFRPLRGSPLWRANWVQPPDDGFFDQWATWIGAFGDEDWTEEWTTFHMESDIAPQ